MFSIFVRESHREVNAPQRVQGAAWSVHQLQWGGQVSAGGLVGWCRRPGAFLIAQPPSASTA